MGAAYSKLAESDRWKRAPEWQKFGFVNLVAHLVAYWGPNLLLLLVAKFNWLLRYKIQKGSAPPAELVRAACAENVLTDLVGFPLLAYPLYKLLTFGGGGGGGNKQPADSSSNKSKDGQQDATASVAEKRGEQNDGNNDGTAGGGRKVAPVATKPRGWAGLQFDSASAPSVWTMVWQVCACVCARAGAVG